VSTEAATFKDGRTWFKWTTVSNLWENTNIDNY